MNFDNVNAAMGSLEGLRLQDFILPYRELPGEALASIEKLIDGFDGADETERARIVQRVERSFAFVFQRYARRAAEDSIRKHDPTFLKRGLIALAIENGKVGWRDSLPFLAFLYNSARKLNINATELFRNIGSIALTPFRTALDSFLHRDEASRTVESFHYKESGEGQLFTYLYCEPRSRQPSLNEWQVRTLFRRVRRLFRQ